MSKLEQLKELEKRYDNTQLLVAAVDATIQDPTISVADTLAKGNSDSKKISAALVTKGAAISAGSVALISTELAAISGAGAAVGSGLMVGAVAGGGLAAGAISSVLGGPIAWAGGGLTVFFVWLFKRSKRKKEAQEAQIKKEKLMKDIIRMQQALIDKLQKENAENKEKIRNLEEAFRMMQEAEQQVKANFACA